MGKISILTMMTMLCLFGHSFALPTMDEIRTTNAEKEVNTIIDDNQMIWIQSDYNISLDFGSTHVIYWTG